MLIKNAKIITMNGSSFEEGFLHIEGDRIAAIGKMTDMPSYDHEEQVIDATNAYVLPGFIDAHCHLGIWEDGLRDEDGDGNETSDPITPHLRGLDAVNPMDRCFEEALDAGITTVVTGPGSANPIGGQMVALKTFGTRIDDMVLRQPVAMKMAFGENPKRVHGTQKKNPGTRMASVALIRETLFKTREYMKKKNIAEQLGDESKMPTFDMKLEALIPVLERRLNVHMHAHRADDIFSAIRVAREFNLNFTIVHCTEGHLIADQLKEENVSVIIGPIISERSKPELRQSSIKNAAELEKRHVPFAICTDHPVIPIQYLNTSAGLCVREELPFMAAVEALTIRPAVICGIDDMVGSLEVGKKANISIFSTDPLSVYAKPKVVILDGIKVRGE